MHSPLILASTSRYRAELLQRLKIPFEQIAPDCDETPHPGESALTLVDRLAQAKAASVASVNPQALIICSDQVACCQGDILGKPGDHHSAVRQLQSLRGNTVEFHTGLCVTHHATNKSLRSTVTTTVEFKNLNDEQIERYLQKDQPYDCAASFRSESYGSTIVSRISTDDPTALIGLPIVRVAEYLDEFGFELP